MKFISHVIAAALCLLCSCASSKNRNKEGATLNATELQPYGRYTFSDNKTLELISSAVHFGFTFYGKECQVFATVPGSTHNYLQYELDGIYEKRLRIEGSANNPIRIRAQQEGIHTIWIYKATEAHTGSIFIQKITGKNIRSAKKPEAPLIEFIGNSITCGAAADPSEVPCGTGEYHDQHNAYYAYGPRLARLTGSNFVLSSVSGIGVYRNWNSDGPTMPQVYEKADFRYNNNQQWHFDQYTPAIVSIALGTNDFSSGDGIRKRLPFDSALFVNSYFKFVQLVKSKYPAAQIALLSSPMVGGNSRVMLQNCLLAVKDKTDEVSPSGKPVALYFFKPMQAHGCTGHPNVEDHALLADELIPFFKRLLP